MAGVPFSPEDSRDEVPEVVVSRLPQYLRILNRLMEDGIMVVSSQQLGEKLQVTPAQIRKDLSYFGRFGKQGRGYSVRDLLDRLRQILGVNAYWNVAVVGVGRLGRAIVNYPGFTPDGFSPGGCLRYQRRRHRAGRGRSHRPLLDDLRRVVTERNISIAIVAVPVSHTQEVVDLLVACGVRAILNYAPIIPHVREGVRIRNIDPVLSLQSMTYYINSSAEE